MGEATTCSSPDLGHLCNNHLSLMSDRNLALALNPLHPDGWFALGSASLKVGLISQFFCQCQICFLGCWVHVLLIYKWILQARELDSAINAFTRSVQLNPENGESWNNLAAL
jgi:hypothetical protein